MPSLKTLSNRMFVCGQLRLHHLATIKGKGIRTIVNNQPEGESFDQPRDEEFRSEARAQGLIYYSLPVPISGYTEDNVVQMSEIMATAPGPILAFCRSGTRSALVWAMAEARNGGNLTRIENQLEAAGFRSGAVRIAMRQFAPA